MTVFASVGRGLRRGWPWTGLVGAVVVGGLAGGLIAAATDTSSSSSSADVCSASKVANDVLPSVVTISARGSSGAGTGSGEVIRSNGYILTNNHVISIAASGGSVQVLFSDGLSAPATITGRDPATDLAVIKVDEQNLPVIPFASSNDLVVGQPVVVLGAPLGLSSTVTSGIVSALDRTIEVPGDNGQNALLVGAVQTDAAINPGNSGGSMTNCSGDLIGVPSAGATVPNEAGQSSAGSVGIGFAIPSNLAQMVSNEIIETGGVTHAYFGMSVAPIPPAVAAKAGTSPGLFVVSVSPGGPAQEAGLQEGDVITEINGEPATDANQLYSLTLTQRAGETVSITYERDGHSTQTKITLGSEP
ncbi:MAG TPA: trypsin-like peptidase domain-containing protein [Acidimicrobiales bacterium]|nr:trypsin-like peptidase domain-containing protein [Acidimicrobiales bacterium]